MKKSDVITNATTTNEILNGEMAREEERQLSPYATNAMRKAIIKKSLDGRTKAIDAKFCAECGVSTESLDSWKYNVESLYEAAIDYSRAMGTEDEEARRQECWRIWRTIIKVGEEDALAPKMFVREKDVENMRVLAAESTQEYIPGIGFVATVRGKINFRGLLEIRLALRIAGNAVLNDADRDTVVEYRKAVKAIKTTREVLEGKVSPTGEEIPSVYTLIEKAEAELEELENTLKKTKGADVEKLTRRNKAYIKDLHTQQEAAEKRLLKYLKVEKDLRENYNDIVAKLDAIEGTADKKPEAPAKTRADIRAQIEAQLKEYDNA